MGLILDIMHLKKTKKLWHKIYTIKIRASLFITGLHGS
jgi:hypothetical protein